MSIDFGGLSSLLFFRVKMDSGREMHMNVVQFIHLWYFYVLGGGCAGSVVAGSLICWL